jgi:hypothetical protein
VLRSAATSTGNVCPFGREAAVDGIFGFSVSSFARDASIGKHSAEGQKCLRQVGGKFSQDATGDYCGTNCHGGPGTDYVVGCKTGQTCIAQVIGSRCACSQRDVRFTLKSGHGQCNSACPLRAKSGHCPRQNARMKTQFSVRIVFARTRRLGANWSPIARRARSCPTYLAHLCAALNQHPGLIGAAS